MALIKCPECKKKISNQCEICPNCGYPIKSYMEKNSNEVPQIDEKETSNNSKIDSKKSLNKKSLIIIVVATIVVLVTSGIIIYNALLPRINATKEFNAAVLTVEEKNIQLEEIIKKSEDLILEKQPLLDETLLPMLETAISDAKAVKETNFKIPSRVDEIILRTEELYNIDYTTVITSLSNKHSAVVTNAKRYQLVNHPTEAYVIQCLKTIPEIVNISAVTEDNDPNGNLNKAGGYTATVYFAVESINLDKSIYGETLIDQGTDAGGGIEVYTCVEDAVKRCDYLATFDGGVLASGSHTVIGTVLVRTSDKLTASQQKALEKNIIAALTFLPEADNIESNQDGSDTTTPSTTPTTTTTNDTQPEKQKPSGTTTAPTINKNQEAVKSAEEIGDFYATVSPYMVKEILMSDYGYSESQSLYAIKNADIDWNYYAVIHLEDYVRINDGNVTKADTERYLSADLGYSDSAINYAFAHADVDWNSQNSSQESLADNCQGHHFDVPTCQTPSTCIYCGLTEGEPVECQYINGICHFCGAEAPNQ